MTDIAEVFYKNIKAGLLIKKQESYEFEYYDTYLNDPDASPISAAMPLLQKRFYSERLFAFFENLLPEGVLLDMAVAKLKIDRNNKFELLLHLGQDTVGAVTVRPLN